MDILVSVNLRRYVFTLDLAQACSDDGSQTLNPQLVFAELDNKELRQKVCSRTY